MFFANIHLYFDVVYKFLPDLPHGKQTYQFFIFLNGIQTLAASFFSSSGKHFKGIIISMSKQLVLLLPLILFLSILMGVDGILYAGPASDLGTFAVATALSLHELKKMPDTVTQLEGMTQQSKSRIVYSRSDYGGHRWWTT